MMYEAKCQQMLNFLERSKEFQLSCEGSQSQYEKCTEDIQKSNACCKLAQSRYHAQQIHIKGQEDVLAVHDQALVALTAEIQGKSIAWFLNHATGCMLPRVSFPFHYGPELFCCKSSMLDVNAPGAACECGCPEYQHQAWQLCDDAATCALH